MVRIIIASLALRTYTLPLSIPNTPQHITIQHNNTSSSSSIVEAKGVGMALSMFASLPDRMANPSGVSFRITYLDRLMTNPSEARATSATQLPTTQRSTVVPETPSSCAGVFLEPEEPSWSGFLSNSSLMRCFCAFSDRVEISAAATASSPTCEGASPWSSPARPAAAPAAMAVSRIPLPSRLGDRRRQRTRKRQQCYE